MNDRVDQVLVNHDKGYNCAQAVACAYADLYHVGEAEAFRAMEAFGRGMGAMTTCGAVSAMTYLVGLKLSDVNLDKPKSKAVCYKIATNMLNAFKEKNQSTECRELKGVGTGIMLRTCDGCMEDAARIVEEYLLND
ncbi:C-GCAxxG-C-C family protein [Chakrabartyella piscis]|uniref:C-GCAxxG-C-C family protein n=1 Tax=Chakrabartyella piscis TaxID=2918914 RepID=UPI002958B9EC|nr:C-GCAxxG-C-C family protein [Chakrabartyella piscis]